MPVFKLIPGRRSLLWLRKIRTRCIHPGEACWQERSRRPRLVSCQVHLMPGEDRSHSLSTSGQRRPGLRAPALVPTTAWTCSFPSLSPFPGLHDEDPVENRMWCVRLPGRACVGGTESRKGCMEARFANTDLASLLPAHALRQSPLVRRV